MKGKLINLTFFLITISLFSQEINQGNLIEKGDELLFSVEFFKNKKVFKYLIFNTENLEYDNYYNYKLNEKDKINIKQALNYYLQYYNENIKQKKNLKNEIEIKRKIAFIYLELKDYKKSIVFYKKLSKIYGSQFVSHKLMDICIKAGFYEKALFYANIYFKKQTYSSCGNAIAESDVYRANMFGKIYSELGNYEKSLEYLIPQMFYNGMAYNRNLVILTSEILHKIYSKKELRVMLDESLDNIYLQKYKTTNYYYTKFLNIKISVPNLRGYSQEEIENEKKLKKELQRSQIYKLINPK